jgi:hypothetical protein
MMEDLRIIKGSISSFEVRRHLLWDAILTNLRERHYIEQKISSGNTDPDMERRLKEVENEHQMLALTILQMSSYKEG